MFDIMNYPMPEERDEKHSRGYDNWYAFKPSDIYPATFKRIKELVTSQKADAFPVELVDNNSHPDIDPRAIARLYLFEAKSLPLWIWDEGLCTKDAAIERSRLQGEDDVHGTFLDMRAHALDLARRWFTQALNIAVGPSIGIHILKDERFKL